MAPEESAALRGRSRQEQSADEVACQQVFSAVKIKAPPIGRGHEANLLLQDEVGAMHLGVTADVDAEIRMSVAVGVAKQMIIVETQLARVLAEGVIIDPAEMLPTGQG